MDARGHRQPRHFRWRSHDGPSVIACCSAPDRSVLIEVGNTDAWIASDRTSTVEP